MDFLKIGSPAPAASSEVSNVSLDSPNVSLNDSNIPQLSADPDVSLDDSIQAQCNFSSLNNVAQTSSAEVSLPGNSLSHANASPEMVSTPIGMFVMLLLLPCCVIFLSDDVSEDPAEIRTPLAISSLARYSMLKVTSCISTVSAGGSCHWHRPGYHLLTFSLAPRPTQNTGFGDPFGIGNSRSACLFRQHQLNTCQGLDTLMDSHMKMVVMVTPTQQILMRQIITLQIIRECHGQPWGFPGQPAPIPVKTRTRMQGYGFPAGNPEGLLYYL